MRQVRQVERSISLDYQIEHHLFPYISHPFYAQMSPLVRKVCEEQGILVPPLRLGRGCVALLAGDAPAPAGSLGPGRCSAVAYREGESPTKEALL